MRTLELNALGLEEMPIQEQISQNGGSLLAAIIVLGSLVALALLAIFTDSVEIVSYDQESVDQISNMPLPGKE